MKPFKIGVAIPCHIKDRLFLKQCLFGIENLNPKPYRVEVDVNEGERSLHQIRENLFDKLFSIGCDVVLQCDSDFYLFPKILRYIDAKKVTTFSCLARRLSDVTMLLLALSGRSWTGCYSIPRNVWFNEVRDSWNGTDADVLRIVGRKNVVSVKTPSYYALRAWQKSGVKKMLKKRNLLYRLFWMGTRFKAIDV